MPNTTLTITRNNLTNSPESNTIELYQNFLCNTETQKNNLSNAMSFWDTLPKYSVSQVRQNKIRSISGLLPTLNKKVIFSGITYEISISPALLENGTHYYPSANEALVEDCIRYISARNGALIFDDENGYITNFSLYEIGVELKKHGHSRSYQEIQRSLEVLSNSFIEIRSTNNQLDFKTNYMKVLGFATGERSNTSDKCIAIFNPMVCNSINNFEYRQFNYEKMMSINSHFGRWLFKYIVLYRINVGHTHPIKISLQEILIHSGIFDNYKRCNAIFTIQKTFSLFIKMEILTSFQRDSSKRGYHNSFDNIYYSLQPSNELIKEVKAANKRFSLINS